MTLRFSHKYKIVFPLTDDVVSFPQLTHTTQSVRTQETIEITQTAARLPEMSRRRRRRR